MSTVLHFSVRNELGGKEERGCFVYDLLSNTMIIERENVNLTTNGSAGYWELDMDVNPTRYVNKLHELRDRVITENDSDIIYQVGDYFTTDIYAADLELTKRLLDCFVTYTHNLNEVKRSDEYTFVFTVHSTKFMIYLGTFMTLSVIDASCVTDTVQQFTYYDDINKLINQIKAFIINADLDPNPTLVRVSTKHIMNGAIRIGELNRQIYGKKITLGTIFSMLQYIAAVQRSFDKYDEVLIKRK